MLRSFFLSLAFILLTAPVFAADAFTFDDAFIRETPMKISAGYVTAANTSGEDDVLQSAAASWAGKIEIHDVSIDGNGVLTMKAMDKGAPVKAGETLRLFPGGKHLMIYDLKEKLKAGETRAIVLHFEKAGEITVPFAVKPITYRGKNAPEKTSDPSPDAGDHSHHH